MGKECRKRDGYNERNEKFKRNDRYESDERKERKDGCRDFKKGIEAIREGLLDFRSGKCRRGIHKIEEGLNDLEYCYKNLCCK